MDTSKRHPDGARCECAHPEHSCIWVECGTTARHTVDIELCENCGNPIRGTETTHVEADDDDEQARD
jgi:hypothetical protein